MIKCEKCDFTTNSEKGFKTHMKRKHYEKTKEPVTFQCEFCEYETKRKIDLKRHTKSHSYTFEKDKCKCNQCDFTGNNAWTLQIHNGKSHNESIECGLCDFVAKDLDMLNLHLKTCEIYECNQCEHVSKKISSIKNHVKGNNDCISSSVHHVKIDRHNDEEADSKEYRQDELF